MLILDLVTKLNQKEHKMKTTIIPPLTKVGVIVRGPLHEAYMTISKYTHWPLRNSSLNGYGNIHGELLLTEDQVRDWFALGDFGPGALLFYKERN